MVFAKRSLVVLALAVSVSFTASAFNTGALVRNTANNALKGNNQAPVFGRYVFRRAQCRISHRS